VAEIVLYSQPGCSSCFVAKEFLASHGIAFPEKDVRSDPEFLRELVEDLKSRTTPTLVVGEQVLIGFDPDKFQAALEKRDSEEKK